MGRLRWQLIIALGGLILIAALLLTQVPGPDQASPEPVRGGTYAEAVIGSPMRLNPVLDGFNQVDRDINRLLYTGLVRFNEQGVPEPDLAENWAISADGLTYTVTLRADAVWHDGVAVTSDDVIYTFSKLQDADYPGRADLRAMWEQISLTRLDDRTVQFKLPEAFSPFLDYLSVGLLPDHLLRGVSAGDLVNHPVNLQPIGTGPFRFVSFEVEDGVMKRVSLAAFDDYYGQPPYLERVDLLFFDTQDEALQAYEAGGVQGIAGPSGETLQLLLADPEMNTYSARLPSAGVVFLNTKHPEKTFLGDKSVRQALLLAVNRQSIIDRFLGGQAVVATGPVLPGTWAYAEALAPLPFDPERAASLLDAAGWAVPVGAVEGSPEYIRASEELPLAFTLVHADDAVHAAIAQALQEYWGRIGVVVTLKAVPASTLLSDYLEPRDFEAVLTDLDLSRYPDPDPYPFWHDSQAEAGQNYSGFSDRNTSIWLEQARTTPDLTTRSELYRSFQYRFQDQTPSLFLYHPVFTTAVSAQMQGVALGPMVDPSDRFGGIERWYILARRARAEEPETTPNQ
ncbi:MAG: peptide ABC transporter substrate-binding protein [Chloroflexi bacterium]|nr:peptide ABC transporter substrate-binding protein [Chloroflexota bacterium]